MLKRFTTVKSFTTEMGEKCVNKKTIPSKNKECVSLKSYMTKKKHLNRLECQWFHNRENSRQNFVNAAVILCADDFENLVLGLLSPRSCIISFLKPCRFHVLWNTKNKGEGILAAWCRAPDGPTNQSLTNRSIINAILLQSQPSLSVGNTGKCGAPYGGPNEHN